MPPSGRKFDGVVDEVGDRLDQQIAIAAHAEPMRHLDPQADILVLGDRFVDIADLAQHFVQRDAAEARRPPAVLDLGQTQQRRDDRQRLIDTRDRLVRNRLKLLQRGCVGAPALEREPRARQRRSQIVGDVVADAGERVDHRFHFIEHAIDDDRELRKRLVDGTVRKPLAQIAGDDALNPLVDLLDPLLGAHAQPRAGQQAQTKAPAADPAPAPDRRHGRFPWLHRLRVRSPARRHSACAGRSRGSRGSPARPAAIR